MKKKIFIIIFFILVLISIISYAKYKNEYVDCKVERNDKSVSIVLNIKCYDTLDCSYNKLIQHYEEQGMTCEEEDTTE